MLRGLGEHSNSSSLHTPTHTHTRTHKKQQIVSNAASQQSGRYNLASLPIEHETGVAHRKTVFTTTTKAQQMHATQAAGRPDIQCSQAVEHSWPLNCRLADHLPSLK